MTDREMMLYAIHSNEIEGHIFTDEERETLVMTAFAMAVADGSDWKPTGKGKQLFLDYINGVRELTEVEDELLKMFRE